MTFSFIKYVRPTWTFSLVPNAEEFSSVFYHPELAPLNIPNIVAPDNNYETDAARWADIGYRAFHKGNTSTITRENYETLLSLPRPTINDEYRFVAKYWGRSWTTFVLVLRLLGLKNPFKEIRGYMKSLNQKTVKLFDKEVSFDRFNTFNYPAELDTIKVSVIIPTLNRYVYLKDVLEDLEKQEHKNFDVIIVDQSEPCDREFYKKYNLDIKLVEQKEKLLWNARNNAIRMSDADYLLFFDDDSRVNPDWITNHLKCLFAYDCDVSAGVSNSPNEKVTESYRLFRWADQFDSGNALVKRKVFEKVGLFDQQFNKMRMGDGEFGYRVYLGGFKSISNPLADRLHLKVGEGGLRQMGSWDGFRPKKFNAPRPIPSVLYLFRTYFKPINVYIILSIAVPRSVMPYKNKRNKLKVMLGSIGAMFLMPIILVHVRRSWNIASRMLKEGNKIGKLEPGKAVSNH